MLIKRNLQTEVRVALFGEAVEHNMYVCVCGHVSSCSDDERLEWWSWSL